jgi:hypothetical protein
MKTIRRMTIPTLFCALAMLGFARVQAETTILSEETSTIHGATHTRVQRHLTVGQQTVLQTYHTLSADHGFTMISGDDYTATGYRPATVLQHAKRAEERHSDYVVVGGINADFFESYGVPQEAYINNGDILSQGIGYAGRSVVGFKNDGTFVHGKPVFDGYEVIVRDANGKERIRLPLTDINTPYVASPIAIYAYFDTYRADLPPGVAKTVVSLTDHKGALPKIFGKGEVIETGKTTRMTVSDDTLVLVSDNIYLKNLVEEDDIMVVQPKMVGDFAGVRWAVGAYGQLVSDGKALSSIGGIAPRDRHPRSALGVRADGSVFFITVDGRQNGYSQGATLYEVADLMVEYGAQIAYNFDGGGSTTMVLRDEENGLYVANRPSDGSPRLVTNSLFIAIKTGSTDLTPYPIPDYSTPHPKVEGLSVHGNRLSWNAVTHASSYTVEIGDETFDTRMHSVTLDTHIEEAGTYPIRVRAKGDGMFFGDSPFSDILNYVYAGPTALPDPTDFTFEQGILTWDWDNPSDAYLLVVDDKTYTLSLNRFNLATLSLDPGIHEIRVRTLGDEYLTHDSHESIYTYRVYSDMEGNIKETMSLILELLFLNSKKTPTN